MRYNLLEINGQYLWEDLKLAMGAARFSVFEQWVKKQYDGWDRNGVSPDLVNRFEGSMK
jgi:hypothetical protein